ncbi:hypothetical protein AAG570_002505 [Ranatra chinensis]|uniref:Uncharacterized protein n=1 Tax=Ranatra chinensis TaxID=642074 RepID=A0ABD0Y7R9_9HEMI
MASKRRNMFYENKKQETTEIDTCNLPPFCDSTMESVKAYPPITCRDYDIRTTEAVYLLFYSQRSPLWHLVFRFGKRPPLAESYLLDFPRSNAYWLSESTCWSARFGSLWEAGDLARCLPVKLDLPSERSGGGSTGWLNSSTWLQFPRSKLAASQQMSVAPAQKLAQSATAWIASSPFSTPIYLPSFRHLHISYTYIRGYERHTITKGWQIAVQLLYSDHPQSLRQKVASKRRNMFQKNKMLETTQNVGSNRFRRIAVVTLVGRRQTISSSDMNCDPNGNAAVKPVRTNELRPRDDRTHEFVRPNRFHSGADVGYCRQYCSVMSDDLASSAEYSDYPKQVRNKELRARDDGSQ